MKTTRIGGNTKWIIAPAHRSAMHAMLVEALGATVAAEPSPAMTVFGFPGGDRVGVEVDPDALSADLARKGAWLELVVEDPEAVASRLDGLGVARVPYRPGGESHMYFQAPGGPVFRLAAAPHP